MAPFKRYVGLRVAAVTSAASLLVLGLQAPALAASPTISSFSPTSGPAGCVVVIAGTNFKDPMVTSVDIGGAPVSGVQGRLGDRDRGDGRRRRERTNPSHKRERYGEQPVRLHQREPGGTVPQRSRSSRRNVVARRERW
jgi:hypothetical protein